MRTSFLCLGALAVSAALAQEPAPAAAAAPEAAKQEPAKGDPGWRKVADPAQPGVFVVEPGTRIPLALINSVSTKHSGEGDRVYLETVFPVVINGKVVIPPGSYVAGTVTQLKRPGRVKGKGELFLRFDSLTLPNGTTRDFRARIGSLDGRAPEELDKEEGKIKSEGNKSGDARTIGEAAATGASVGVIAGGASGGHYGMGAGIGALGGAAAGMLGVLLSRGPDAVLAKGSTIEMVLDRPLRFEASELDFSRTMPHVRVSETPPPAKEPHKGIPMPGRRWPL